MATTILRGTSSVRLRFLLGVTGLSHTSSGLVISTITDNEATATVYTQAASNLEDITAIGTYAAPSSGKARIKEVDATNHPGLYEIQLADARFNVSGSSRLVITCSGAGLPATGVHYEVDIAGARDVQKLYGDSDKASELFDLVTEFVSFNGFECTLVQPDAITDQSIADGAVTDDKVTQGVLDKAWTSASRTLTAFSFSVTVGTNNDKTGYSLTQAFPANFAALGINAFGNIETVVATGQVVDAVTVGIVNDKTGYSLASNGMDSVTLPSNIITPVSIADNAIGARMIASNAIQAAKIQDGAFTAGKFAASSLDGKGDWLLAANYTAPSNSDVGDIKTVTDRLDSTIEEVSAGLYRFTSGALSQAPTGSGGGGGGGDPIIIQPVAGQTPERFEGTTIRTFNGENFQAVVSGLNLQSQPINWLEVGEVEFVVDNRGGFNLAVVDDEDIIKTETYFSVLIPAEANVIPSGRSLVSYRWSVRNKNTKAVVLEGPLIVSRTPLAEPPGPDESDESDNSDGSDGLEGSGLEESDSTE